MHIGLAWLKWLTVVVPTAFMAVFTLWGYSFLDRLSLAGVGAMIVVVVVGVAAFLFSRFVFSSIQGLQQTVLQRNRELSALYSVTREASKSLDPAQVMTRCSGGGGRGIPGPASRHLCAQPGNRAIDPELWVWAAFPAFRRCGSGRYARLRLPGGGKHFAACIDQRWNGRWPLLWAGGRAWGTG